MTNAARFGLAMMSLTLWGGVASSQAICSTCHRQIAERWSRSPMARSFGVVDSAPEGKFNHKLSGQLFSISNRLGASYLRREDPHADPYERRIDYWIGSGNHARSYISRNHSGDLVELPLTWYALDRQWAMSPAYDRANHAGFGKRITYRCMFCHNAYPSMETGRDQWDTGTHFPGLLPAGIDCQRCHGDGRAHVDAAQRGESPDAIRRGVVNPAKLPAERSMEVCLQCHLETTSLRLPASLKRFDRGVFSYQPGEPLSDYILHFDRPDGQKHFEFNSAAYRLPMSACFLRSEGALTCVTCHSPHGDRNPSQSCHECHGKIIAALSRAGRHSASQDCVSCHMPKRTPADALRVRVTDHFISRRPAKDPPPTAERNDSNTPPYRGEVALYYPKSMPPDGELYLALAQIRDDANGPLGLQRLESAVVKYQPRLWQFAFELGEGYRRAGQFGRPSSITDKPAPSRRTPPPHSPATAIGIP